MAMIKQPIKPSNPLQFPLYSTVRQNLPLNSFLSTSISSATKAFGRLTCKCDAFCFEMSKDVGALVREFDPAIPLDKAMTPPSSWYTNSAFLPLEMERVFYRGWQAVGFLGQVENPHDFFTGRLGNVQFVICRDGNGDLHAFHNVCRHHASLVASGSGKKSCFVCPYHLFEKVSIQTCQSAKMEEEENFDRLGKNAVYAFIYPNFMINRYGPWMDTNLVVPLGTSKCQVIFDYFLEDSHQKDKAFIERSLLESDRVQMEDISLSEGVQAGLTSPAYKFGRYAPRVEMALHHFHCLLYGDLVEP